MIKTLLKGESGLTETKAFAEAFPIGNDPDNPTILSVDDFDLWAAKEGYYTLDCDQDTRVNLRNRLRNKVNHTAANEAWTTRGNSPFHVQVRTFGQDYVVSSVEDAFNTKAMRLPAQIKSVARTKHQALKELLTSVDFAKLPPGLQVRVNLLEDGIERYVEDITYATTQINRQFHSVQAQVAKLGIAAPSLLSIPHDDEVMEDA